MLQAYLGIDVSKNKLDVGLQWDKQAKSGQFTNNPTGWRKLHIWVQNQTSLVCHCCLEATGRYGNGIAHFLHEQDYQVSVVNPARINAFAHGSIKPVGNI